MDPTNGVSVESRHERPRSAAVIGAISQHLHDAPVANYSNGVLAYVADIARREYRGIIAESAFVGRHGVLQSRGVECLVT